MTSILFSQILLQFIFLTVVFLHIAKKNSTAVLAYGAQSLAIALLVLSSFFQTGNMSLLFIALLILVVKVILAPAFFMRLIQKKELVFAVSTYLSTPLTLIVIAILTAISYSDKFTSLTSIIVANKTLLSVALSAILLSLFLIINRKSVMSQIIGILSLENSIVAFATFAGLEQSFGLQAGILFDIAVWVVIATVFVSMIYNHFGSLEVTDMENLTD